VLGVAGSAAAPVPGPHRPAAHVPDGVPAGALIAFGGQYLMRRTERQERNTALLLEQCAVIVALSHDYRNRVWEERNDLSNDAVANWDIGSYRLAEARLRILAPDPGFIDTLTALRKTGIALGTAWRLSPGDETALERASSAHNDAIGTSLRPALKSPRARHGRGGGPASPRGTRRLSPLLSCRRTHAGVLRRRRSG
jgi:hypothetical protein